MGTTKQIVAYAVPTTVTVVVEMVNACHAIQLLTFADYSLLLGDAYLCRVFMMLMLLLALCALGSVQCASVKRFVLLAFKATT